MVTGEDLRERVYLCGPCSSALDVAHHLASVGGLDAWDSVLVSRQWAGRGQMRRAWISDPGNLFAAWRLPFPPEPWRNMISVLMGWILCQGLRGLRLPLQLKWPNDLLLHGRKVGGILVEERGEVLLAGIGLNLSSSPPEAMMRTDHVASAGTLGPPATRRSIFELWIRLVNVGRLCYISTLSDSTLLEFSHSIETVLAYLGTMVQIVDNRSSVRGLFRGLSPDGGIVLHTQDGTRTLHSGSLFPEDASEGDT